MKTPISRVFALLMLSVPFCQADVLHYTVNFAADQDVSPTGTFTYNTATTLFETFDVTVLGYSLSLLSSANAPYLGPGGLPCLGGLTGAPAFFHALQQPCPNGNWILERVGSTGYFYINFLDGGRKISASTSFSLLSPVSSRIVRNAVLTATEQSPAVPEPTFALPVGLAIGALAWRRGRQK